MTALTLERTESGPSTRPAPDSIPFSRVMWVELTKMFDTRAGFWLMMSIGISAALATASVIVFAPTAEQTYDNFGAAIGIPMVILLPIIAILSVTSEWSQRSGLTTFTLLPHRGRVIWAKMFVSIAIGALSMVLAFGIGAVGNLVGAAIAGVDPVWDISMDQALSIILANVLQLLIGFMLGVLIRNSAGALVAYFVYNFVLSTLTMLLALSQEWFRELQPWVDFNFAQGALFDGNLTSEQWAQLGTAGAAWLVVPLVVGLMMVMRSEVK
jgi:hypothetical protein